MNRKTYIWAIITLFSLNLSAQKQPEWDNTSKSQWPSAFSVIDIPSSKDGNVQKAYFYKSTDAEPQPLIISLHTWSGNYAQKDPLTKEVLERNWNYIHPNFRGANRNPEAMGSPLALADIEDAIRYALKQTNANPDEVHIVGVSGGGHATLAAYMNIDYPVKSFSAWVPISDIEGWYWESVGRSANYAKDILKSLSEKGDTLIKEEAIKRSPLYQAYPKDKRKNARLYIYSGIHDGYKGSVPITHSINIYNRLVGELKYGTSHLDSIMSKAISDKDLVSQTETLILLGRRINSEFHRLPKLLNRNIHLLRKYNNIQLIIFEGRHEQLPQALDLLPIEQ